MVYLQKVDRLWHARKHVAPGHEHSIHALVARGVLQPSVTGSDSALSLQSTILAEVSNRRWGADDTQQQRRHVLDLVRQLQDASSAGPEVHGSNTSTHKAPVTAAPTDGPLGGHWQLMWTTEASVHKLVKGQLLGIPVENIQQQIDLRNQRVINLIRFALLGLQLQASGPLKVLNSSRIYYSFDNITLGVLGLQLALPLFVKGGGWTDCIYVSDNDDVRVMKNSRQDTLILSRI